MPVVRPVGAIVGQVGGDRDDHWNTCRYPILQLSDVSQAGHVGLHARVLAGVSRVEGPVAGVGAFPVRNRVGRLGHGVV